MKEKKYVPDQGDLVWLNFDPQSGHEQAGKRPALVISPRVYNAKAGLMIACPLTTKIKRYPFEVEVEGPKGPSAILADQVKSLDWSARGATFIKRVEPIVLEKVQSLIKAIISS